jgi:Domain of unknown function (DUF4838)/delta endotoxin
MHKFLISILVVVLFASSAWSEQLSSPSKLKGASLLLADKGKTSYSILLPAKPSSQEKKAAEDLKKYLSEITGASFPVINETGKTAGNKPVISIGRTNLLTSALADKSSFKLEDEGYAIYEKNGNLFLFGGKISGPISAVIAFLEEDLACRWYAPDCIVIPKQEKLLVSPNYRKFVPVFSSLRDPYYRDASNPIWMFYNRLIAMFPHRARVPKKWGGIQNYPGNGWGCHTYNRYISRKKFSKTHPEYFARYKNGKIIPPGKAGQLCLSNPEVLKMVISKSLKLLAERPDAELIDVSQNDSSGGFCQCEQCRNIYKIEGNVGGATLRFANAVAKGIEDIHPEVKVTTLAYEETFMPPKKTKPGKNVMITLATDKHAWPHPYLFVTETKKFKRAAKAWADIGANIRIWDYTANYGAYLAPRPNMGVMKPNLQFYLKHNAKGVMFQGSYQYFHSARAPMRSWVMAKLLWNPSLDTQDLIKEFTCAYYGKAAEPLQQYNEMLWTLWEKWHKNPLKNHKGNDKLELDNDFIKKAVNLFKKAEKLAENKKILKRVQLAKLSILYGRLDKGLVNAKDKDAYLKDMEELATLVKKFKLKWLSENQYRYATSGIKAYTIKWKSRMDKVLHPIKKGVIVVEDTDTRLSRKSAGIFAPKIVKDPLAENGFAIRQPGNNVCWSIQWSTVPKLQKGMKYSIRIRFRIDKRDDSSKGKVAFGFSIYNRDNPAAKRYYCGKNFSANKKTDQYEWHDVGSFISTGGHEMFYIAPKKNPSINAIYIDKIEFTPVLL